VTRYTLVTKESLARELAGCFDADGVDPQSFTAFADAILAAHPRATTDALMAVVEAAEKAHPAYHRALGDGRCEVTWRNRVKHSRECALGEALRQLREVPS
jgi:hypothetical protein